MKENSINSEKYYLKDPVIYPAYSINSGKSTSKRRIFSFNFDINNYELKDTIDDFFLKCYQEENHANNLNEINSNFKLYNYTEDNISNSEINLRKRGRKKEKKEIKIINKKRCGRKLKNSIEKGIHNKYSSDNIIRKCKAVLLQIISKFINNKIKEFYGNELNYNPKRNRLLKMNQFQVVNSNVKFNQQFLNKKLKDIFSEKLSSRCTTYSRDHNKQLILYLLNDKDNIKKQLFNDILNLTFLDCLQHFRGSTNIECLNGLKDYDEVCEEFLDENYKESFRCYIDNFEKIIKNKKSRRNKKHI